ncbi:MAG: outer membrane protein assembly factor BamB family protein, partial [Flavobacteriales bacterium]
PMRIETVLYGVTADQKAIARDAATGKEVWRFQDKENSGHSANRGVSFYHDGKDGRIFFVTGPFLYALNAKTGKPINTFGKDGKIDLHIALPENAFEKFVTSTTPGTIYKNLIIMPVRVAENESSAPGNLVAIDCNSGELVWRFHTIPHPGEPGYHTWKDKYAYNSEGIGGANNWAGMSLDETLGLVYVPTGSVAPDFYGGAKRGSNLFANSLLA